MVTVFHSPSIASDILSLTIDFPDIIPLITSVANATTNVSFAVMKDL